MVYNIIIVIKNNYSCMENLLTYEKNICAFLLFLYKPYYFIVLLIFYVKFTNVLC